MKQIFQLLLTLLLSTVCEGGFSNAKASAGLAFARDAKLSIINIYRDGAYKSHPTVHLEVKSASPRTWYLWRSSDLVTWELINLSGKGDASLGVPLRGGQEFFALTQ